MKKTFLLLSLLAVVLSPPSLAQSSLEQRLDTLQQEIDRLKAEVERLRAQQPAPGAAAAPASAAPGGTAPAPAAATPAQVPAEPATSLFGYGEFNYNRYSDDARTSKADLRRFVFGIGHSFNDRLSFNSEVEFEHGVVSSTDQGEAEIEQAFLNYKFSDALNVKGGLFLIPLGILNETHEPPTFFGVERNEVETRIIPTTWRELGVGLHGLLGEGFKYDVGITTGFNAGKLDDPSFGIRSMHQEGQLADAHDLSIYGALNYRSPGWLVGGGFFTGNTGQNGQANPMLAGVAARLKLWDLHAKYSAHGWDLQALYTAGTLGDAERINAAILATSASPFAAPRAMNGWYAQAAYHLYRQGDLDFAPFVRFEGYQILQQQDLANGLLQDPNNLERVRTLGFNFRIHPQVVIKSDWQRYATDGSKNRFNVGLGYMF